MQLALYGKLAVLWLAFISLGSIVGMVIGVVHLHLPLNDELLPMARVGAVLGALLGILGLVAYLRGLLLTRSVN